MSTSHSERTHTTKEEDRTCDDNGAQPWTQSPSRVQTLLPELLSEIFLIASYGVSSEDWFPHDAPRLPHEETVHIEPTPDSLPWTLTHVCKSWRRTALTTPALWSQISLELGEGGKYYDSDVAYYREEVLRMASTWIRLSRNSPLYVSISIFEDPELPEFLLDSMGRWRGLQLNAPSVCDLDFLDLLLDEILPDRAKDLQQLEHLSVQGAQDICLSKFPNVKHLSGKWLKIIPEPDAVYQIRYLRAFWRPEDSLPMMASLPSLTTLFVEMDNEDATAYIYPFHCTAIKQITSPTEGLYLTGGKKGLTSILSCTAFPAVCDAGLTITSTGYGYEEIDSSLQECLSCFFQECSSTLTRLNLTFRTSVGNEDIIKTLYHATSITHLTLSLHTKYDEFLHVLYALEWCNSREDNLCAHLVSLKIPIRYYSGPDEPSQLLEQLIRTVRSRMEKNKSVQVEISLSLWQAQAIRKFLSNHDELRSLQDQGVLKLNLH